MSCSYELQKILDVKDDKLMCFSNSSSAEEKGKKFIFQNRTISLPYPTG
jgi:hypothetical protein